MDTVLAGLFTVPLHFTVQRRDGKGVGNIHATIALDPPDDFVGRRIKIGPAAMIGRDLADEGDASGKDETLPDFCRYAADREWHTIEKIPRRSR
jgi:hypothetical protein